VEPPPGDKQNEQRVIAGLIVAVILLFFGWQQFSRLVLNRPIPRVYEFTAKMDWENSILVGNISFKPVHLPADIMITDMVLTAPNISCDQPIPSLSKHRAMTVPFHQYRGSGEESTYLRINWKAIGKLEDGAQTIPVDIPSRP
jgi:hypothetical protein